MPGIVTRRFRHHNADQFYEAFTEASPSNLYLYIGRIVPWSGSPPVPTDTVQDTTYEYWRSMLAAKKVQGNDITFTVPRYDWQTGTVYRQYDDQDVNLYSDPASSNSFFIRTSDYRVYKCLFNNKGAQSTVEPTSVSTTDLQVTSDGYRWKYMYTIDTSSAFKFITNNFMPTQTLSTDTGSDQWDVQQNASNGAIDIVIVTAAGDTAYKTSNGVVQSIAVGANTFVLSTVANTSDDVYNTSGFFVTSGAGAGQVRQIADFTGSTNTVVLASDLSPNLSPGDGYHIAPMITITGDGTGAVAYSNVALSTGEAGSLNYIKMISTGSDYSEATVTITANTSHGSGAAARAIIPPLGGHGSDAVTELGGHNVMVSVQLTGTESETFPVVNDFHRYGLVRDPILYSNGAVAAAASYDQTIKLTVSSGSIISLAEDSVITGDTSGANAYVVYFSNTNASNTAGTAYVVRRFGQFTPTEQINGTSINITAVTEPPLVPYEGDIIYVEQRGSISRDIDQTEDIKLVVKF